MTEVITDECTIYLLTALMEEEERLLEADANLAAKEAGLADLVGRKLRMETALALLTCDDEAWVAMVADQPTPTRRKAKGKPNTL